MPTGPRPLTPNVAEVTMEFTQDGQYLYNKHHFFDDAGWDAGRLNNLGTAVREWWDDNFQDNVAQNVTLTAITVRDLSTSNGAQVSVTVGLPSASGGQFGGQPNSITVAIRKATGLSGRSFHGRTYHVGLTSNLFLVNHLTAGAVTQLRDKYTSLINPGSGLFAPQLCVLSEVSGGDWRPTGVATIVTGISVDSTLDNQRRRLPGRGR